MGVAGKGLMTSVAGWTRGAAEALGPLQTFSPVEAMPRMMYF